MLVHPEPNFQLVFVGEQDFHMSDFRSWIPFANRLKDEFQSFDFHPFQIGSLSTSMKDDPLTQFSFFHGALHVSLITKQGKTLWQSYGKWSPYKAEALDTYLLSVAQLKASSN